MLPVTAVVLMLMGTVWINSITLKEKLNTYSLRETALQEQIEEETERSQQIDDFEKYSKTKAYYEEVARDKLGLVYPDEIIITPEN